MKNLKNNGVFYVVISLLAVMGIVSGLYAYSVSQNINVSGNYINYEAERQPTQAEDNFGAFPGPDVFADVNVYGSLTHGSSDYNATSTSGEAATLLFKDLNDYTYIDVMNNRENLTWTLPATATMMQILPEVGSTRAWFLHNATSTANKTFTISAGAGMDLVSASTTADVLDSGNWAKLECTQIYYRDADNQNIMCNITKLPDAD